MATITFINKKGGVGKSTLSFLLHESLRQAQKDVAIRDWDPQGTSNKALQLTGGKPADLHKTHDVLIYDTPPNLEHVATATAVAASDLIIIVSSPSPADLWEAEEAAKFARERAPNTPVFLLFNKVKKGTLLAGLIEQSAKQVGIAPLKCTLTSRECYQHAIGRGWKALDGGAREEILKVTMELLSLFAKIAEKAQPSALAMQSA
jgi:chromosome partitioning protein